MGIENWRSGLPVVISMVVAMFVVSCGPRTEQTVPEDGPEKTVATREDSAVGDADHAVTSAKTRPVDSTILAEGKVAWRSCAQCHCATDPRIEEDDDWVLLNEETTCIETGKPAPRLRKSILAYLRHPETLRPILVNHDAIPGRGERTGKILLPETAGSAYLRADRGSIRKGSPSMVRLYWDANAKETSISAPIGKYNVINFWFYRREGKRGEERWMLTGTNVHGCTTVRVDPDAEEILDLEPVLYGHFTAKRTDGRYALAFSIQDTGGTRMTLSKNGRVVMPGYRIVDEEGKVVAGGSFGVT